MTTATALTLASLISDVTTLFTAVLGWLTSILAFVAGEPILFVLFLLVLVKIVMRICRRWLPGI